MTLWTRVWRQPVCRYRFLSAHTLFLLLNNGSYPLPYLTHRGRAEAEKAQVDRHLALQDQDSDKVVRPSHGSPRGMRWRQGRPDKERPTLV